MGYKIDNIASIVQGKLLQAVSTEEINYLSIDSRTSTPTKGTLFFAIVGETHDGHAYINDCYEKGIRNFVISNQVVLEDFPSGNFLLVQNVKTALQQLTIHHRHQFDLTVIGVTGSNGKTIIKEWLAQLLAPDYTIVKSPKSYNSQVGVPLSIWAIDQHHELGIFEAGISTTKEMERIAPIIDCNIGIFTNIGDAHNEGFESKQQKIQEKLKLFEKTETLIYRAEYQEIDAAIHSKYPEKKLITWSTKKKADLQITHIDTSFRTTILTGVYKEQTYKITVPFTDEAYLENCIHCWTILLVLNTDTEEIEKRLSNLQAIPLRLELKAATNNCTLINDSYNNDLNSLEIALDFLLQQTNHPSKILVVSDILQSGLSKEKLYKEVANLVASKSINQFIGIGAEIQATAAFLPKQVLSTFYPDTASFIEQAAHRFKDAAILLKGARKFRFEQIANALSLKAHKTSLEINLSALTHNLNIYRNQLQPATKIMVMVKASGYGSGSFEVAKLLEFQQVDYLAVAYTDEGVELRKAGIQLPIMVMNPESAGFDTMIQHQLEPEIYQLSLLSDFNDAIQHHDLKAPYPIHLKLDTGMKRLGFEEQDLERLIASLKEMPGLEVVSIFSHLSGSETKKHDLFSRGQIELFQSLAGRIRESLKINPMLHILNSAGIVRFPENQLNMVRLGIGLYGIDASGTMQDQLQTVSSLKATISQIKWLNKGDSVGYGRATTADKKVKIGTMSIGYADGFMRQLSLGVGSVWLHGKLAPVIGKVCMDMTMIDLSDIQEAKEGDEVEIFGNHKTIQDFSRELGTIPYEVFTLVSGRVKRVYFQE